MGPISFSTARACGATHVITTANAVGGTGNETVAAIDGRGNRQLVDAAGAAGITAHRLHVGAPARGVGAVEDFAAKLATEDYLKRAGSTGRSLQRTAFMETWAQIVGEPLSPGTGIEADLGSGRNPLNFVAVNKLVAAVADAADAGPPGRQPGECRHPQWGEPEHYSMSAANTQAGDRTDGQAEGAHYCQRRCLGYWAR